MRKPFRCFELLLPIKLNNGQLVPNEAFADTTLELERRLGAVSSGTQTIEGMWRHEEHVYRDESTFVDVPDTEENRDFSSASKILKERFQQLDIWMTTFPLEVL